MERKSGGMRFKYARIQGRELAENTMYAKGIFSMCMGLIQKDVMDEEDKELHGDRQVVLRESSLATPMHETGECGMLL